MMSAVMELLAALSAGIAVGCFALFLLRSGAEARAAARGETTSEFARPLPVTLRLLRPLARLIRPSVSGPGCRRWCETEFGLVQQAGYAETLTGEEMVSLKIAAFLVGVGFLLFGVMSGAPVLATVIGVLILLYPTIWVRAVIRKRHLEIMKALPNVLDLLTLSVDSGKDLVSSLRDILVRRRPDALGEELTRAFQEIQLGRPRSEALRDMAKRVRQPDLTSTVNAIVQAEELGVSIVQLLRIQSDMQRGKRFSLAEEQANQAAVKILVPVALFILPAVFIILLGPLALQTIRMFR